MAKGGSEARVIAHAALAWAIVASSAPLTAQTPAKQPPLPPPTDTTTVVEKPDVVPPQPTGTPPNEPVTPPPTSPEAPQPKGPEHAPQDASGFHLSKLETKDLTLLYLDPLQTYLTPYIARAVENSL